MWVFTAINFFELLLLHTTGFDGRAMEPGRRLSAGPALPWWISQLVGLLRGAVGQVRPGPQKRIILNFLIKLLFSV